MPSVVRGSSFAGIAALATRTTRVATTTRRKSTIALAASRRAPMLDDLDEDDDDDDDGNCSGAARGRSEPLPRGGSGGMMGDQPFNVPMLLKTLLYEMTPMGVNLFFVIVIECGLGGRSLGDAVRFAQHRRVVVVVVVVVVVALIVVPRRARRRVACRVAPRRVRGARWVVRTLRERPRGTPPSRRAFRRPCRGAVVPARRRRLTRLVVAPSSSWPLVGVSPRTGISSSGTRAARWATASSSCSW